MPSPKAAETAVIYKGDKWDNLFEVLRTNEDLHEAISDIAGESLSTLITDAVTSIRQTLLDGFHLALGFSGGKDSTCVLHLVLFAMVSLIRRGQKRPNPNSVGCSTLILKWRIQRSVNCETS